MRQISHLSRFASGRGESGPVGPNGFLQRNRLIAALSSALVVVEAQEKSGTMSTVNHAERYGKPVFVVPGSIYSPNSAGTNALLREGRAKAVCKPGDLSGVLGLRGAAAPAAVRSAPAPMSETERRVLVIAGTVSSSQRIFSTFLYKNLIADR